jgi:predicted AlkP superfamily pyrophosphatase or phosphodiesterase
MLDSVPGLVMTRHRSVPFALLCFAAVAIACGGAPAVVTSAAPAPGGEAVVLVSLDGFRADYINRPTAVNLRRLASEGVRAERMVPSFPSLTFPNHYAIVTGEYPEHNGIVDNTMSDPVLGSFRMADTIAVHTAAWWTGEPIWTTAERQGRHAGSVFWPGSEVPHNGVWPSRFMKFNDKYPRAARIDTVLTWLTLPPPATMAFVAVYFSDVDHAGHDFGPGSPQVDSAIARVDTQVGRLMDGLVARGLSKRVNIIVVADHGMVPTPASQVVFIDDYISMDDVDVVDLAEVGLIAPKPGKLDDVYRRLHDANPHMQAYRKADVPARFHFNNSPRITPIVLIPDVGWTLTTHDRFARKKPNAGGHGFDNQSQVMGALFVAAGPAFRQGITVPPFQNIHLYDMMCHILGITPAKNDGSLDSTRAMLRP